MKTPAVLLVLAMIFIGGNNASAALNISPVQHQQVSAQSPQNHFHSAKDPVAQTSDQGMMTQGAMPDSQGTTNSQGPMGGQGMMGRQGMMGGGTMGGSGMTGGGGMMSPQQMMRQRGMTGGSGMGGMAAPAMGGRCSSMMWMMLMMSDPKMRGQMMQIRGQMLREMGDMLIKRGKELEQGK